MPKIRNAVVPAEERKVIGNILRGKGFNVGNPMGYCGANEKFEKRSRPSDNC